MAKELEEEENTLRKSLEKLKSVEESRTTLVKHLREALREQVKRSLENNLLIRYSIYSLSFVCQESELENLQSQIQVMNYFHNLDVKKKVSKNQHFLTLFIR